jgi:hypothetical protein
MLFALDPTRRWERTRNATLWTGSLYQLARDYLDYKAKGLRPLSLDGIEGREYQRMLANDALNKELKNSRFVRDLISQCTPEFRDLATDPLKRDRFIGLVLNEFASIIDAEGVRLGTDSAQAYMTNVRDDWLMSLPTEFERGAVLFIHDQYCKDLDDSQYLSLDQMIGDFSRYLMTSAEWRQLRNRAQDKKGFDLIFVDEFHHFNRIEAGIFHNLFSRDYHSLFKAESRINGKSARPANESGEAPSDEDRKQLPPLFMAYDLKQSATDAGVRTASLFRAAAGGETTLVELTKVFRSTPAIAAFLADFDGAFPAYQMAGEWPAYPQQKPQQSSDSGVSTLQVFSKNTELLDGIFATAEREAIKIGGRHVAVLCLNDDLFETYLHVGRKNMKDKYVAVKSRSDIGELRYVRRKVVFSMPQHVQGLQFESVYLINLDQAEVPPGASESERRRFITRCYIGASRAVSKLAVASSEERGGPCNILNLCLNRGSLKRV